MMELWKQFKIKNLKLKILNKYHNKFVQLIILSKINLLLEKVMVKLKKWICLIYKIQFKFIRNKNKLKN